MDWLKKNYERAILAVAILALIGSSVFIVMGSMDFPTTFATRNSSKRPDNTIKPLPIEVLQTAAQAVDKAKIWTSHDGSLFISRPYVLLNNELIDPLAAGKDLHAPITNAWLIKYDLPYWEGDIKDQDPDGDRFSNLEEFVNNTDPLDAKSVPPYWTKLRLAKFISKPFRLKFTGTPDEGQTFTINAIDGKSRTQFLQLGQMIEGTPYKLLSYKPNKITRDEMEVDVSELTIENTETNQKLVLIVRKEANDPTSFGEFLYLYDNSRFTVKKDDEFTLTPQSDKKYKLIDISRSEALIKDLQSGEEHKILPVQ
ncbi:MAG: hypothetical protein J0I10_07180 [Verrucomicrobia bacterium]|nr:hypothetical protein [Verrucomicrobiota bacterium]